MSDGIQKLRQSKLFWLFMVAAVFLLYNYDRFQIHCLRHFQTTLNFNIRDLSTGSKNNFIADNMDAQTKDPLWSVLICGRDCSIGPGNPCQAILKTWKDHLDYQIIVVRNSCANDEPTQNFDRSRDSQGQVYRARSSEVKSTIVRNEMPIKSKSVPELVIYNRVPKCGSTTMLQILSHIKDENNFTIFNQIEPNLSVRSR